MDHRTNPIIAAKYETRDPLEKEVIVINVQEVIPINKNFRLCLFRNQ